MQDFIDKKIVVGISGGIAAYKSAYLVRELTRLGAKVRVVMTSSAQKFITPMTLQALSGEEVRSELFDATAERAMGHIELARWADYFVIAPATANCMAKLANGMADDLLSTLYLVAQTPVLVCPAMNRSMWAHPATVANCETLTQRGVILVGPEDGSQACGEVGLGRMSEVETIIQAIRLCEVHQLLSGRHVLITAGPTREPIDPVRYISNHSSGKMGYALAQAALMAGATVTLITGPTVLTPPTGALVCRVNTAKEMFDAVMQHSKAGMIFIGTAAVADYRVDAPALLKLKKQQDETLTLSLTRNPDILAAVADKGLASYVVGFAAETNDVLKHAQDKLKSKKVDMIMANQVGAGLGFDTDDHQVTVLTETSQTVLAMTHKARLAAQMIAIIAAKLQNADIKNNE
jgi:phosphopantothenoylcysteine decarboxylase/phosphopantothenate--cysteine ligase